MCQAKSIAQVIEFEGKQKRRPQHLAFSFPLQIKSRMTLICVSLGGKRRLTWHSARIGPNCSEFGSDTSSYLSTALCAI
jgi:hypothetical protein